MSFVERHDWKVWVFLSVIIAFFGVGDIQIGGETFAGGEAVAFQGITGMTWDQLKAADPAAARLIDSQVRSGGALLLFIGLLNLAIALYGLRRGERWAWFTMWLWPGWLVLLLVQLVFTERVPGAGVPVPAISGTIFLVLTLGLLALSYRKYLGTPARSADG